MFIWPLIRRRYENLSDSMLSNINFYFLYVDGVRVKVIQHYHKITWLIIIRRHENSSDSKLLLHSMITQMININEKNFSLKT